MTKDVEIFSSGADTTAPENDNINENNNKSRRIRQRSIWSILLIILGLGLLFGLSTWYLLGPKFSSNSEDQIYYTGAWQRNGQLRARTASEETEWQPFLQSVAQNDYSYETLEKLYDGVPDSFRQSVWSQFLINASGGEYSEQENVTGAEDRWTLQIDLDIDRTLTRHFQFRETPTSSPIKQTLRHILLSYSESDPSIGYCQGMNFPVAFLLTYFDAEQAEEFFFKLMKSFEFRRLYESGFDNLREVINVQEAIMQDEMPDLFNHFRSVNVESMEYAVHLYLTWFTEGDLNLAARIWDLMPIYNFDYAGLFPRVVVAILKAHEHELIGKSKEAILMIMRDSLNTTNPDAIANYIRSSIRFG